MLTVGIEKDHPRDFSTDSLPQSGLDCLAFAAVLIVNNHFGTGFARALCSLIARAVINHKNVVKSLAGPPDNVADVFFVLIRRNNRGCLRSYFYHVERSRGIALQKVNVVPGGSSTALRFARNDNDCKRTCSAWRL